MIGSSWFILKDDIKATFIGNSAVTIGGAIHAFNEQTDECMLTTNGSNISMLFYNNTASQSGISIFSNNLYHCSPQQFFTLSEARTFYHIISNGTLDKGLSTMVDGLCICWQQNSSNCTIHNKIIVYPGMMLQFPVATLDVLNQITFAEISLNLLKFSSESYSTLNMNWYLDLPIQTLSKKKCTLVNVTFFMHSGTIVMILSYCFKCKS